MWKATIKGILARKVRLALTALAVRARRHASSAGTYVLDRHARPLVPERVQPDGRGRRPRRRGSARRSAAVGDRQRFPETVRRQVAAVAGVGTADGVRARVRAVRRPDGENIQTAVRRRSGSRGPRRGVDGPLRLVPDEGRPATRPRARPGRDGRRAPPAATASMSATTCECCCRAQERFRIVGLFGFGPAGASAPSTFAAFDLPTAQRVLGATGRLDCVNVIGRAGDHHRRRCGHRIAARARARLRGADRPASSRQDRGTHGPDVPEPADPAAARLRGDRSRRRGVHHLQHLHDPGAQRTRELGLLRAMGASGSQVVGSVVAEAAIVGALASAVGLAARLGARGGPSRARSETGFEIPQGPSTCAKRTIIVAIAVGLVVTVASSIWPAVRAARVPPIAAINDVPPVRSRPFRRAAIGGLLARRDRCCPFLVSGSTARRTRRTSSTRSGSSPSARCSCSSAVIVLLATFARPLADALGPARSRRPASPACSPAATRRATPAVRPRPPRRW